MVMEGYEAVEQSEDTSDQPSGPTRTGIRLSAGLLLGIVLIGVSWAGFKTGYAQRSLPGMAAPEAAQPSKVGAGLLFLTSSGDQVLLLKRSSKHNDATWGLPGGNAEQGDADLQATALREATEELGTLPSHSIGASLLTKRGKNKQKHYTVFLASLNVEEQAAYVPQLNEEHSEWKWWDISELASLDTQPALHPVVSLLMQEPLSKQLAAHLPKWGALEAAEAGSPAAAAGSNNKVKKLGAGLLLVHGEDVLLLKRNSSHNNATWDIPGGNVELGDKHLFASAKRECEEEMGPLPDFIAQDQVKGEILTKRGKHDSKHFTVYVLECPLDFRNDFKPQLSDESLGFKWWDLEGVAGLKLKHPRLEMLFEGKYKKQLEEILALSFSH